MMQEIVPVKIPRVILMSEVLPIISWTKTVTKSAYSWELKGFVSVDISVKKRIKATATMALLVNANTIIAVIPEIRLASSEAFLPNIFVNFSDAKESSPMAVTEI